MKLYTEKQMKDTALEFYKFMIGKPYFAARDEYERMIKVHVGIEIPDEETIRKEANEYEKKASCGTFEGGYINDDFIAGANFILNKIKEQMP